jgi:hypothetical protein
MPVQVLPAEQFAGLRFDHNTEVTYEDQGNILPVAANLRNTKPFIIQLVSPPDLGMQTQKGVSGTVPVDTPTGSFFRNNLQSQLIQRANKAIASAQDDYVSFVGQEGGEQVLRDLEGLGLSSSRVPGAADADYVAAQAEYMRLIPPLVLLVNPTSFSRNYTKRITDGAYTRKGHVAQFDGEELPTIDCSGQIGAYVAADLNNAGVRNQGTGGVTRWMRRFSASWQNLMSLWTFYRNNGYVYHAENTMGMSGGEEPSRIALVGAVQIYYDGVIYLGSFDEFSMDETEDKPHSMSYSFKFTFTNEVDTGQTGQFPAKDESRSARTLTGMLSDALGGGG